MNLNITDPHSIPIEIYSSHGQQFHMQLHSHMEYEIYYFHHGKCNYLIGDKIHVLSPGDLILMHGMTLHCPNVDPGVEYSRTIIHFEPSYVQGLALHSDSLNILKPFQELKNCRLPLQGEEKRQVEQILGRLEHLYHQRDVVSQHRFHLCFLDLLYVIYGLCQKQLEQQPEFPSAKEHHVQSMISYFENHFHLDIHLEYLEKHLHLNKYYLVKIFKEVTGQTIFTYLYQRRINQAKMLFLLDKEISVTEACYQTGFKHPAHFSRIFKQYTGFAPEQYRKIMASANTAARRPGTELS